MAQEVLHFTKMQGVGNDFVVIDARDGTERDWPGLARTLCRHHFGIGADGLLVITPSPDADAGMRMFNPDGTEDFCGNGLRCVARYVADHSCASRNHLRIATIAGIRTADIVATDGKIAVKVDMGEPLFEPHEVPVNAANSPVMSLSLHLGPDNLSVTALSTGSTHAVTFVEDWPDDDTFFRVSPLVENHPAFPERTSLLWVRALDSGSLDLRIWERGVGETLGCGTGACAAMVAARLHGLAGDDVAVRSRGGTVRVTWDGSGPVYLTGPAEYVFRGRYRL